MCLGALTFSCDHSSANHLHKRIVAINGVQIVEGACLLHREWGRRQVKGLYSHRFAPILIWIFLGRQGAHATSFFCTRPWPIGPEFQIVFDVFHKLITTILGSSFNDIRVLLFDFAGDESLPSHRIFRLDSLPIIQPNSPHKGS